MSDLTLEFLGHATFVIRAGGESLIVDPYPEGDFAKALELSPIDEFYDYYVSSHGHVDHAGGEDIPGPPVRLEDARGPFSVRRVTSDHDEYDGRRRGGQVDLLVIEVGGVTLVHASDIGRSPGAATIASIRFADVLLVPVGGYFTIGAAQAWEWCLRCSPTTIVPMHYGAEGTALSLRDESAFLLAATWDHERRVTLDLVEDLRTASIFVMEPTKCCAHPR